MSKSDTIWRRLRKRGRGVWWLPVAAAVLGAMVSMAVNSVRPTTYEVSTRVEVVASCGRGYADGLVFCSTSHLYRGMLQSSLALDGVIRQFALPGEGLELLRAIDVDFVGYNEQLATWLEIQRSGSPFVRFIPRPPEPPPLVEIRVRHIEPETALQISQMMVNAVNEWPQEVAKWEIGQVASYTSSAVHDLNLQLVYLGENPRYEAERAALEMRLDSLLTHYSYELQEFEAKQAAGFGAPLLLLEPSTIRTYPRRGLGLVVGGLAGLVVGLAAVMVRRYWVD